MRFGGTTQWTPPPNSLGQFMVALSIGCGRWGFSLPPCGLLYVWHGNSRNSRIVRLFSAISAISAIFRYFSNVANTVAEDNADAGVWDTWSSLHFLVGVRKAKNIITQIFHNWSRNIAEKIAEIAENIRKYQNSAISACTIACQHRGSLKSARNYFLETSFRIRIPLGLAR